MSSPVYRRNRGNLHVSALSWLTRIARCQTALLSLYLKLQFVTIGALAVNKQNCMRLAEEY